MILDEHLSLKIDNLTSFVEQADNPRIKASASDVQINIAVSQLAGVIVVALIAYVVSVFVVHSIECESTIIGTLYALGVSRRQLMLSYAMLPVLVCLAGGVMGTVWGSSPWMVHAPLMPPLRRALEKSIPAGIRLGAFMVPGLALWLLSGYSWGVA